MPVAEVSLPSALGVAVCNALRYQVVKLGLSIGDEPVWDEITLRQIVDPYSQQTSVIGIWQGRLRYGSLTLFPDGRVFAEYQVLQPHPEKEDCYVEAVQVWGKPGQFRGDAVLVDCVK